MTPQQQHEATTAYLAAYEGPWGLKASPEDALLAIICSLDPQFPQGADGIYAIRADQQLTALTDYLNDLAIDGLYVPELVSLVLSRLIPLLPRDLA